MFFQQLRLILVAGVFVAPGAWASVVRIQVGDAAGLPLSDAVVMLQPASTRLAVKPLAGVQVSQAQRQFNPRVTVVTVGTAVTFPNFDTVRHHVYSFSPAKTFELKLYAGTPAAPVVFDKPGIAVLGCNIHDRMAAWIVVSDTPLYASSGTNGQAQIDEVPAGSYRLLLWHPGLAVATEVQSMVLNVGATDVSQRVTLGVTGALP
jgi:plastocyanin